MKLRTPLLALAAIGATPAYACSVVPGYRVPSNYELVDKADLVVLARVASGPASEALKDGNWGKPQVRLEPIRAIKGVLPAEPLAVSGYVSIDDRPTPRFPTPLHIVHPSALMGACIRQQYAVGALVVAVFKRDGKQFHQEGSPFARSVEDVEGVNGTWVRAADSYARIVALPAKERPAALEAEARRLLDSSDDTAAPAIAADMFAALEQLPD
ncbi:hypothetical protein RZN05_05690 [Sphingomonas sp. HF-S4]|uniref:Lipoprotein n=1 Tax=Sphingomonas agrestis TaxID=3080540 RepID=A0ABU3Y4Y8_9SPHN|nr:hypothetical protein [Sphingomonas sp. HF-S4]MDV3456468.1 hypothetical protein [Sphingomonas sp. HF-S4]